VLDLLPHWPKDALEALDAYFLAHAQMLPDGRLQGMSDAMAILRAWYIGSPGTHLERIEAVKELSPRDFEYLVYSLYNRLGYARVSLRRRRRTEATTSWQRARNLAVPTRSAWSANVGCRR
jgi:restriction system protein